MKQTLLLILISCFTFSLEAQINFIWTGAAGNNDWSDGGNWNQSGAIPSPNDYAKFNIDATVINTGATPTVLRLIVGTTSTVTLDMDLDISSTMEAVGIQISANNGVLNLGNGTTNRKFNILVSASANAIRMFSSGAVVTLGSGSELNIMQSLRGIYFDSSNSTFTNNGTINITKYDSRGIHMNGVGTFENNGTLTIQAPGGPSSEGMIVGGTFNNNAGGELIIDGVVTDGIRILSGSSLTNNGTITIDKANTDGIIALSGSSLTNNGTINVTIKNTAAAGDNGIEVKGVFNNNSSGVFNGDGGTGALGRPLVVSGQATNEGTINLSGGQAIVRLLNNGTFTNEACAVLNLGPGGRVLQNAGSFLNKGFVETDLNACIRAYGGTATNNAFYSSGLIWGAATGGTVVDNGVRVPRAFDAGGACTIDLSTTGTSDMIAYSWAYNGMTFANNGANGILDLTGANLPDQATYTLTITSAGCGAYNSEFTVEVEDACSQALPVEFISFEATSKPNSVLLNWATAMEDNNDYFSVERSSDGRTFEAIGMVKGVGNSVLVNEYEFTDMGPSTGINYYRLKQVDFDGRYEYSDVINVEHIRENDDTTEPGLYPNPANHEITIIDGEGLATVYNQIGQPVLTFTIQSTFFTQDVSPLLNGQYYLRIEQEGNKTLFKKFTVLK